MVPLVKWYKFHAFKTIKSIFIGAQVEIPKTCTFEFFFENEQK
jgi:hypothetical protein